MSEDGTEAAGREFAELWNAVAFRWVGWEETVEEVAGFGRLVVLVKARRLDASDPYECVGGEA